METNPNPPQFNLTYNQGTSNIGAGYAAGIDEAGKSLSSAIGGVFDIANRNQNVNDTLSAMQQSKMLSPDQYQAVMGKSLGARESMLGMYASQWIADQAAQRQLGLAQGTGAVEVDVAHQKLLDTINAVKSGYGAAAGVQQRNLLTGQGNQGNQGNQPAQPVQPTLTAAGGAALPLPRSVTPAMTQQATQLAGGPLGAGNIYAPGPKLGAPISRSSRLPVGATVVQGTSPKGETAHFVRHPDGTLQEIQ